MTADRTSEALKHLITAAVAYLVGDGVVPVELGDYVAGFALAGASLGLAYLRYRKPAA